MSAATTGRRYLPLYCAVVLISYTSSAGITTVYSMLSLFYREFGEPLRIGWVVTSYWLVASVCAAICGRLGDVVGRRRMSLIMLGIAGVGSLVSARSPGLTGIIAGCALQGATGTLTPLSLGIVRENLPRERVPFAVGILTAAGTTGAGLSFMVAGFFIDHYSWRGGFYMKAVLVVLAMIALLVLVPPPARRTAPLARVNLLGGLVFAPAIAGIFVSLQLAKGTGWTDPLVWGVLLGSIVLLVTWGWQQSRAANPLIDVRSLGERRVLLANLSIALLAMGCMQNGQIMSLFLQQPAWTHVGFGLSATAAGMLLLPLNAITLFGSPWGGNLTGRRGARRVALIGFLLVAAGWTAIAVHPQSFYLVIAANVVALFGLSFVQPAAYITVVQATAPDRTSEATGMTYVFLNTFIAIGGQIVFLLLATSTVKDAARGAGIYPSATAYLLVFGFVIATALAGLLVVSLLPRHAAVSRSSGHSPISLRT